MTMQTVPKNQVWPTQVKFWERERRSPPSQSLGMKVISTEKNPLSCADYVTDSCNRTHSSVSNDGRVLMICEGLMAQPLIKPKRYRCSLSNPVWNCSLHLFSNRTKFHVTFIYSFYLIHLLKLVSIAMRCTVCFWNYNFIICVLIYFLKNK